MYVFLPGAIKVISETAGCPLVRRRCREEWNRVLS